MRKSQFIVYSEHIMKSNWGIVSEVYTASVWGMLGKHRILDRYC